MVGVENNVCRGKSTPTVINIYYDRDNGRWVSLLGKDEDNGIPGYGDTPANSLRNFINNWESIVVTDELLSTSVTTRNPSPGEDS